MMKKMEKIEKFANAAREDRRQSTFGLRYAKAPHLDKRLKGFSGGATLLVGAAIMALGFGLITYLIEALFDHTMPEVKAESLAGTIATLGFFTVLLWPYIVEGLRAIKRSALPDFLSFDNLPGIQKLIAHGALAFLFTYVISSAYDAAIAKGLLSPHPVLSKNATAPKTFSKQGKAVTRNSLVKPTFTLNLKATLALWTALGLLLWQFTENRQRKAKQKKQKGNLGVSRADMPVPFGLWLGESTGKLATLSHGAGLAAYQPITLFNDDAAQNLLVLGATGSGKTTRVIAPLLLQLLDQGTGGIIFDIKGDFYQTVNTLSQGLNSTYTAIGVSQQPFNLLAGLTPEIASSFLKSAFLLNGGHRQESFWIDTATELCRSVLGLLSFTQTHYSLHGLYRFLFDEPWREKTCNDMEALAQALDDKAQRLFKSYQHYVNTIFSGFDEKVQSGVKATVAQVLSPFNHPDLIDAFCTPHPENVRLEDVFDGKVFVVEMPLARWGLGGKVVYTFLKLRFFNLMQSRMTQPAWNQDRFVFFLCDEYQEIVSANKDGLSDLNFWDKSRSSKTLGIISTQSISSFYAAVGDRDIANALIQNFRQKICFRTEDEMTIALFNKLLGNVEVERISTTLTKGYATSGIHSSSQSNESINKSLHDKPLLDGQFFRTLQTDQALALLSVGGNACDDVIDLQPLFN